MATLGNPIDKKHEILFFFDVRDGNPNGDPDAGNRPRQHRVDGDMSGFVTGECIKRKIRDYVLKKVEAGELPEDEYDIYIRPGKPLDFKCQKVAESVGIDKLDTQFSKHRNNERVYSPYVLKKLTETATLAYKSGMIAYFAAIGEDTIQTVVTADTHLMRRAAERLHTNYSSMVMAFVVKAMESSEELGQLLLDAADTAADEGKKYGVAAIWLEESDLFFYLHCYQDRFHIATVLTCCNRYYVNTGAEVICALMKDGEVKKGISNIECFAPSTMTKYKGE